MNGNLGTAADAEEKLKFLERSLVRLRRSFKLEKEAAIPEGTLALWRLREHSRSHYQPLLTLMLSDLKQLRYRISKVKEIPSSIFLRLDTLEKTVKETQAHFSGTPNRLLRCAGQITGDD